MKGKTDTPIENELLSYIADDLGLVESDKGYEVPPSCDAPLDEIAGSEVLGVRPKGSRESNETGSDQGAEPPADDPTSSGLNDDAPAHSVLLQCAQSATLFATPKDHAYATYPADEGWETSRIDSNGFQDWLRYQYYLARKDAPPTEALKKALDTLKAKARYDSPTYSVHLRVAPHPEPGDRRIYVDLGDEEHRVVRVTADEWDIIKNPPVRFYRTENTGALPLPVRAEDKGLEQLRAYANLADDHFALLLAFLVQCFNPDGPYPLLCLHGEQGSGKSTLTRMIRSLVDPAQMATQSLPSSTRDLAIAAENDWVLAFDNSSSIPKNISDALCRLSTGSGFSTRSLYSDRSQEIFENSRAVVLNGIEQVVDRSDLADRSLFVELQPISDEERRTERELWREFETDRPYILGALLDAVQTALNRREVVEMERMPRMADFAEWVVAAIESLPMTREDFQRAFRVNQENAARKILNDHPVAIGILNLLDDREDNTWLGTMEDLRKAAKSHMPDDMEDQAYPSTPQKMTKVMARIWPTLEKVGTHRSQDNVDHPSHRAFRLTLE